MLGDPDLPLRVASTPTSMTLSGISIAPESTIIVDGQEVGGSVTCDGGTFSPTCDSGVVTINLDTTPSTDGTHVLQLLTPKGLASNEFPFCVGAAPAACL